MKKLMLAATGALIAMGVLAAPAHAQTVCDVLDANPTTHGVEDVIAKAVYGNGMSPQQAAEFIFSEISNYCPRHLFTLQQAMDDYGVGQAHKMRV